ncbi:uncharacterized protein LOC130700375 [Daphnia carinata]|uniref:uncharacterized protein LOC130700375 n=1 Tax=Daphnia carinata TaxID=120202 RepID=UPI00257AD3DE|nr:uncharacterized protein LOC130700375 [Daphnia carinata]
MSNIIFVSFLIVCCVSSAWASLNLHGAPLLEGLTSYTIEVKTSQVTKKHTCYITSGVVTQCRRKRGMEEKIEYGDFEIQPSAVIGIEATPVPRALNPMNFYNSEKVIGSFDDSYFNSQNIFRQIAAKGRSNKITVGDCGQSTVNLSEFLSCLGMTVQETTVLTATFTEIETTTSGTATMTVKGCTPAGFPYTYCP